jgi:DNA-binding MarR family transcriptional regulator
MQERRISFLLNDLVRELNGQADSLLRRKFDITYSQFVFLLIVGENSDIDITRLALSLRVTKGAVSKRMSWFVERDLVATHQTPVNSKKVVVTLTAKGSSVAKAAGDYLEAEFLSTISTSSEFDQAILRTELQKMLELFVSKRVSKT